MLGGRVTLPDQRYRCQFEFEMIGWGLQERRAMSGSSPDAKSKSNPSLVPETYRVLAFLKNIFNSSANRTSREGTGRQGENEVNWNCSAIRAFSNLLIVTLQFA